MGKKFLSNFKVDLFDYVIDILLKHGFHDANRLMCLLFTKTFDASCDKTLKKLEYIPDIYFPKLSDEEINYSYQKLLYKIERLKLTQKVVNRGQIIKKKR